MGEILFLSHRVPWPPNRGDKIRSYHFLRKLMEFAPVHLACFADDAEEAGKADVIRENLASLQISIRRKSQWLAGLEALATGKPVSLTAFGCPKIAEFVRKTVSGSHIDCIFVFSGQMAQFIPADFKGRVVMDFADVDSAKFESYGREGGGPMAWINRREGELLGNFENKIAQQVDYSLFVSEAEADLFRRRSGVDGGKVRAVGNGIDLNFYDPSVKLSRIKATGPMIVFTGQMDYRPNVEAVTSFANDAMPEILKQHPSAQFAIVGRAPTDAVTALDGRHNTIVTGAVDDIRQWLVSADVVVAPLRIARGIQNKVLEAMAMGKPVVASTAAAEGINAANGEHFLVAQDVAEEARLVCELLNDKQKAQKFGKDAQSLIHSRYSWERQLADLPELCGFDTVEFAEAAE